MVAVNDAPLAAYLDPPMTVVRMPIAELARLAVTRLFDVVRGEAVLGDVLISTLPLLVERDSTAPPPPGGRGASLVLDKALDRVENRFSIAVRWSAQRSGPPATFYQPLRLKP